MSEIASQFKRLYGQSAQILNLLRQGPATNRALSLIALKYTSRVSDLRKRGYAVENYNHDRASGLSWYRLVPAIAQCATEAA